MQLVPESVLKLMKGSLYKIFLVLFHKSFHDTLCQILCNKCNCSPLLQCINFQEMEVNKIKRARVQERARELEHKLQEAAVSKYVSRNSHAVHLH